MSVDILLLFASSYNRSPIALNIVIAYVMVYDERQQLLLFVMELADHNFNYEIH